ncbi:Aste57867_5397 [Aphanomyces stellatus]|uniref:Aste57867_5397 protein n=1 Tax=Aphanomyces stellatus TaxID=120398 RepID=A0A485KEJ7_9STRA|nr:hypothetical protein As57867_005384 [Aphanomyces stellatus]VFT82455.1 Aste57867_5397 [Aphanomyces stellatus]
MQLRRLRLALFLLVQCVVVTRAQTALPRLTPLTTGCHATDVVACKRNCAVQYHDTARFTCPCYSKMGECLVRIGCSLLQSWLLHLREGDYTPKAGVRPEIFAKTAIVPAMSPCVDGCCANSTHVCVEDSTMKLLREPGRAYRNEEVRLPPRHGDPRLSVNQNYDLMPYSLPLKNLPPVDPDYQATFQQQVDTTGAAAPARGFFRTANGTFT